MIVIWQRAWKDFVPLLEFPVELRQFVHTSNAIESLNARANPTGQINGAQGHPQLALSLPRHRRTSSLRRVLGASPFDGEPVGQARQLKQTTYRP